jgi:hypothetical protein
MQDRHIEYNYLRILKNFGTFDAVKQEIGSVAHLNLGLLAEVSKNGPLGITFAVAGASELIGVAQPFR